MEVADLNSLLKQKLNISDAPMMAYGAMPAAPAQVRYFNGLYFVVYLKNIFYFI